MISDIHIYVCIHTHTHAYIHMYIHTCICTYMHAYMHVCFFESFRVRAFPHVFILTYQHALTYSHTGKCWKLKRKDMQTCIHVHSFWSLVDVSSLHHMYVCMYVCIHTYMHTCAFMLVARGSECLLHHMYVSMCTYTYDSCIYICI